jgi:hypothetical protein
MAEQMFITYAKPVDLLEMTPNIIDGDRNYLAVRQQIAIGRPILFGCSYFGCMFYALLAMKGLVKDLLVVTASDPAPGLHLFEKIAIASGIRIAVVGANDHVVALKILRQLRRGASVATMLDCFYGNHSDSCINFLGRPATSLGTLYRLGQSANAFVVPTASIYRDGRQELDVGEMVDLQTQSIDAASQRINDYFSNLARVYPDQWMGWQNLWMRWNKANLSEAV